MNSAWTLRASGGGRGYAIRLWLVFVAGLAIGGALSATAIGLVAALWPHSAVSAVIAAAIAVSLAIYDFVVSKVDLPQRRSLIPQEVFLRGRGAGFLRFGIEFGSGMRTFVTSASPYILIVMLLGLPVSFLQTILAGLLFGAGRSIGPLQAVISDNDYWSRDLGRASRLLERLGSALAASVALTAALTTLW